ncbi:MAG: glutamine-hydrolyzing carbamoyl-phosphate synthase small subunit, partial [Candidatus Micrarchaeota archaeon]
MGYGRAPVDWKYFLSYGDKRMRKFMPIKKYPEAKLVLEDGSVYYGFSFGFSESCAGEVVFNTGMVGYPQSLTDPSYAGQILTFTYPLLGNYGVGDESTDKDRILKNFESEKIQVAGLVVSEHCESVSHWSAKISLEEWLKRSKVPAIFGVDTRALTARIRKNGVLLGKIVVEDEVVEFRDPNKENLVALVSRKKPQVLGKGKHKIIVLDCGMKNNILRCLLKRDVRLKIVPWDYDFNKEEYDGLFISNGPGDPTMCKKAIDNIKAAIAKKKPIFGICLGNQLLALAAGAKTYKLKYGHRSQNQPCIGEKKRGFITSQNHGFAVDAKTLPSGWEELFFNAND